MSRFIVVTGMSGAGRSVAAGLLEDLGWFVIDNLPAALVPKVSELAHSNVGGYEQVALVMGASGAEDGLQLERLHKQLGDVTVVFLEASTEVLVRRYEATKRRHPFALELTLSEAIDHERRLLSQARATAEIVIDTSELNPHQLRERLAAQFESDMDQGSMRVTLTSFGFKHGLPLDVDMVLDCRFMPNPYWDEKLRGMTGVDPKIQDFVLAPEISKRFIDHVDTLLEDLLPAYQDEGKSYLTVAFGCTGGHHRSVAVVQTVARRLEDRGVVARIFHRDIEK